MTNYESFSFEDLMYECGYREIKKFQKLMKRNSSLPQISPNKFISPSDADEICEFFTGSPIDWYKYKQIDRDIITGGVLKYTQDSSIIEKIAQWFKTFDYNSLRMSDFDNYIIGIVSTGGFLKGKDKEDFAVDLTNPRTIFIGERGSGKSTTVNLAGLMIEPMYLNTETLINNLNNKPDRRLINNLTRRIYNGLKARDISEYACFYCNQRTLYCFYSNTIDHTYSALEYNGQWNFIDENKSVNIPALLYLEQGEITKIAGERDNNYIHELLDTQHSEMHKRRITLFDSIDTAVQRFNNIRLTSVKPKFYIDGLTNHINNYRDDLEGMWRDLENGSVSDTTIEILEDYVADYEIVAHKFSERDSLQYILNDGNEGFFFLYFSRVADHIQNFLSQIKTYRKQRTKIPSKKTLKSIQDFEAVHSDPMIDETIQSLLKEEDDLLSRSLYFSFSKFADDIDDSDADVSEIKKLIKENRLENLQKRISSIRSELINEETAVLSSVIKFLEPRLRILEIWGFAFAAPRYEWNSSTPPLSHAYMRMLVEYVYLLKRQQKYCDELSKQLQEEDLQVKVFTQFANRQIEQVYALTERLGQLEHVYLQLMNVNIRTPAWLVRDLANRYDRTMENMAFTLRLLKKEEGNTKRNFVYPPIEVELRQGNVFRRFQQLSFGQKTGIILKIVASLTARDILILDQPEDNLDASSIVNILIPTLKRLANKQIILVTHNSNLVMGLENANVIVMESLGEFGRIAKSSTFYDKPIIEAALDILEGGLTTFRKKISLYRVFLQHARMTGVINDMEITYIESAFRQLSLDHIRNDLQPLFNDREFLNAARHELKNAIVPLISVNNAGLNEVTSKLRDSMYMDNIEFKDNVTKLLGELDTIGDSLHQNLNQLHDRINDLRLLNIQPSRTSVNIYELLEKLRINLLDKLNERMIEIIINETIANYPVYVDSKHIELVFSNVLRNILRATEYVSLELSDDGNFDFIERVEIILEEVSPRSLNLLLVDNGRGIPNNILSDLYKEKISDQEGSDHGLGGVIIRKLLDLNNGDIEVVETHSFSSINNQHGTIQRIVLPLSNHNN